MSCDHRRSKVVATYISAMGCGGKYGSFRDCSTVTGANPRIVRREQEESTSAVGTIPIPTQQASETGKTEETNPSPIAVALAADVSPHILSHIRLLGHIRRTLPLRERANR